MSETLTQPLSRSEMRNMTVFEELNEILLDLQDIGSEPLPEDPGVMIDQGMILDQIVKTCTARLELIKDKLPEYGGDALSKLRQQALVNGTGGNLALNGFSAMVVFRIGKAATRIDSGKLKKDVSEAELRAKGWLKVDSNPTTSISFSRKVA